MDWVYRRPADRQPLRRLFLFEDQFSLNAALFVEFGVVAPLTGTGQLASAPPIEFDAAADLKAQGQLASVLPIEFGVTAELQRLISASLPIEFGLTASLVDSGAPLPSGGGHFIPQMAGIKSGRRKPKEALELAEDILDEVVAEVLDTHEKPVQRVSRRMKSRIIEIATQRLLNERVLIGEIDAIDRVAARLAKLAVKRRIETRRPIPVPDNDQELAAMMFRLLNEHDPKKAQDDELILLMQILLML